MSIDAAVTKVERNPDGTATVWLGDRRMVVLNPPLSFEACVGTRVSVGEDWVWVGGTKWAERVGYARLRLLAVRKG